MFLRTVTDTFTALNKSKSKIITATAIPLLISTFIGLVTDQSESVFAMFIGMFVTTALTAIISIQVHKILILGEDSVPTYGTMKWGLVESWYFGHTLLMYAICYGLYRVGVHLGPLALVAAVLLAIIGARAFMAFPAIAVGKGVSFKYGVEVTQGHTVYMLLVSFVFPIIVSISLIPLLLLPIPFLDSLYAYVISIISVGMLSIAYRIIVEGK
ncbi:hypothetical protein [Thaumasiovibrio subtropicus]|uniref:hypothetical protein n=1 Tax=Thaumasiovibrio subtropicus TaxID=1891207 RepID=UPI000B34AE2C|nr:hypothetical protein [Thaumasiovibrio subtropicus]